MNRIIRNIVLLFVLALGALSAPRAHAMTAVQVLDKASASLLKNKGITATYTIKGDVGNSVGSIKVKGNKFFIEAGGVLTWYDGRTQWNLNTASREVTVSTPTARELATASPYALVSSYKNNYSVKPLTSKVPGTYAIQLIPKTRSGQVKTAVIYVRSSDFQPVRLDITMHSGKSVRLLVTGIRTGVNLPASTFTFPKAKYPGVKIIDLR